MVLWYDPVVLDVDSAHVLVSAGGRLGRLQLAHVVAQLLHWKYWRRLLSHFCIRTITWAQLLIVQNSRLLFKDAGVLEFLLINKSVSWLVASLVLQPELVLLRHFANVFKSNNIYTSVFDMLRIYFSKLQVIFCYFLSAHYVFIGVLRIRSVWL